MKPRAKRQKQKTVPMKDVRVGWVWKLDSGGFRDDQFNYIKIYKNRPSDAGMLESYGPGHPVRVRVTVEAKR